jgi:hypothetical protein
MHWKIMIKSGFIFSLIAIFLLEGSGIISGLDIELIASGADNWKDFVQFEHIVKMPGKWGYQDLVLEDAQYSPDKTTDCILHFDAGTITDAAGNYSIQAKNPLISQKDYMFGNGSAAFQSDQNQIVLYPQKKSCLFSRGSMWDDFSIEFWLCPVHLSENEGIFLWEGSMKQAEMLLPQFVRCTIRKHRLSWEFGNFFISPEGAKTIALDGIKELIPHAWHHHLVRFDSTSGLFEYLVDGIPEAVTYVTDTGKESGRVFRPFAGDVLPASVTIGGKYTGYLDELRITRSFEDKPVLKKYSNIRGRAQSKVFDLKGSGSLSKRIEVTDTRPGNSFVSYFIRSSDSPFSNDYSFDLPWTEFDPKKNFDPRIAGRFVQLAIEMYPDGTKTESPRVSRMVLIAEEKLPPPAPIGLVATAGNGKITLSWKRVNFEDVKGYRIYYGEEPGNYEGKGANQGSSPVDAGNTTQFELNGLANGTLYFFAIVAYDSEEFPNVSNFSNEVNTRPLGLYK